MPLSRAELVAWASPPCPVCGEPIQRVETRYEAIAYTAPPVGDEPYRIGPTFTVCAAGHRNRVEPL